MKNEDRWATVQYSMISFRNPDGPYQAKCKYPVEGKRCNAKFVGDECVVNIGRHLLQMHDFRFILSKRFSGKIGNERK